ncbi:DNA damage-regulated autophagy modulator protein 2-like [Zophobas morio]|uniref:DNA damage-regulated autophagy modulator protein 2-like n=1 Tax=Zophobas morio TaxID=2755281 RepID=UPI003083D0EA
MPFHYSYILPIICAVWFYVTFILTYIISVYRKDVTPLFPYISDTGTWSPESCIFGIMLNIGALIQALIMYIRYRQVQFVMTKENQLPMTIKKNNKISLYLGLIAAFGVCIVGNFQETNALVVHLIGAVAAFGLGSVYQCMQTRISFQLFPNVGDKIINFGRLFCSVIGGVMFLISCVFAGISIMQFTGDDTTKWKKKDGGYINHFTSAIAEWILAITSVLFLLLYTKEFKNISLTEPLVSEKV